MFRYALIAISLLCTACSSKVEYIAPHHEVYALGARFPHRGDPIELHLGQTPVTIKFPSEVSSFQSDIDEFKLWVLPGRTTARRRPLPETATSQEVAVTLVDGREYRLNLVKSSETAPAFIDMDHLVEPPRAQLNLERYTSQLAVDSTEVNNALLAIKSDKPTAGFQDTSSLDRFFLVNNERINASVVKRVSNGRYTAHKIVIRNRTDIPQAFEKSAIPLRGIVKMTNLKDKIPARDFQLGGSTREGEHTIFVVTRE